MRQCDERKALLTYAEACGSNAGVTSFSSSDSSQVSLIDVILEISNSITSRDKLAANKVGWF